MSLASVTHPADVLKRAADLHRRWFIRLSRKISELALLAEDVAKEIGINLAVLRSGDRNRDVSKARKLLRQLTVKKMGYPGAEVARFLGVTTSAVNRAARAEEVPDLNRYL